MTDIAGLPVTGYLRIKQILGDLKSEPPIPPLIPISRASWWAGVASGKFPKPLKIGPSTTVWRAADIRKLIESIEHSVSESSEVVNPAVPRTLEGRRRARSAKSKAA